jgi:NhaP-type Na+/H+ or K+/H+ antiporter
MYYLYFALGEGVPHQVQHTLVATTLCAVALSIIVHGVSVTPLMILYNRSHKRRTSR